MLRNTCPACSIACRQTGVSAAKINSEQNYDLRKIYYSRFFTKFGGKVVHGARKKPLDLSGSHYPYGNRTTDLRVIKSCLTNCANQHHLRVGVYGFARCRQPVAWLSIKFIISVAHCRLDFTKNSRKNTSTMLNVNTTKITIVDETRECLSRQMMLTYSVW